MKRFLSLLLSISLLMSVNAGTIQVSASAEDVTMIEKTNVITDMTDVENFTIVTAGYSGTKAISIGGKKQMGFYTPKDAYNFAVNSDKFGYNTIEMQKKSGGYIEFYFTATDMNATSGIVEKANIEGVAAFVEGRVYMTADSTHSWRPYPSGANTSIGEDLRANRWYSFCAKLNFGDNVVVTYEEELSEASSAEGVTPHTVTKTINYNTETFRKYRFYDGLETGEYIYLDDLKMYYEEAPYEKAKIESIGTAKVVEGGQNVIPVELSEKIPNITKDHITVTNTETNETVAVEKIATSDGDTHTLDITLSSNLASWSSYKLEIDALAFGEGAKQRVGEGELNEVTDIIDEFTTTKPPFAAKPFIFTGVGNNLNAKAMVVNTTGEPKDMSFVFVAFDSEGNLVSIAPTEHTGFVNSSGEYLEANVSTVNADKFNFFVIDNWTDRNQLFAANYNVDASGEAIVLETQSSCEELSGSEAVIELGELDYENKKIVINLDTKENALIDGILFIYKNGESLSQSNLPVYAEAISTASTGRLAKEITLPSSLAYGEYIVEFSSASLGGKVTNTFNYLSPEEIEANKKAAILADAKIRSDAQGLSEVLMGVNSAGEKVNDNFAIFGKDADLTAYNKTTNKLNVFSRMLSSLSGIGSYDALVTLFVNSANAQRNDEDAAQKLQMVADAKASVNAAGLMQVILGIDSKETVVNDNFELISASADLTVYNSLKNKAATFSHMITTVKNAADWNGLISIFEAAARTQKTKENTPASPSSNNSSYGGSSNVVKETVDPSDVTSAQTSASSRFTDMNGHWASAYVEELYNRGIMKGYEDGSFRGDNSITRAELAKTLVETFAIASGEGKSFADVASGSWYASYVANAATAGIVTGYEDGSFKPEMEVNRQDAVLMLYRALSIGRKLPIGYTFFTDDLDISDYASGAIRTLGDLGIVSGNDAKEFKPLSSITRAEVATIICRAIDYIESH